MNTVCGVVQDDDGLLDVFNGEADRDERLPCRAGLLEAEHLRLDVCDRQGGTEIQRCHGSAGGQPVALVEIALDATLDNAAQNMSRRRIIVGDLLLREPFLELLRCVELGVERLRCQAQRALNVRQKESAVQG